MRRVALVFVLLLVFPVALRADGPVRATIKTAGGQSVTFTVEVARTEDEQHRGLMDRPSLAADAGMLFDFHATQPIAMWMKNTLIPLDMLFITEDGRIAGIAQRAIPNSTAIISSPVPVRAVLELNGGTCDRLHIAVGDRLIQPAFGS
jgi:uncharacterized membrane protein (UPF0127 family)